MYTIAAELGKGGEGQVFGLSNAPNLVLKLYNEPVAADKVRKLRLMAAMSNEKTEQYAAWPSDIVTDGAGTTVGFVMRRLNGYMPLHMLFSPMDRKRIFPDKGYDFLMHVARNLCGAFYSLHSLGLVVGDVNEGNILVDQRGMIAFIDCDSFQIKEKDGYHYCEVGVPRYTPPELLALASFDNVVRTENTDHFSMAILIFQLLFLGRHPFAGRNMTKEDIDEETAIKKHLFAYSLSNTQQKLLPPNDAFPIKNLSEGMIALFHRAFEQEQVRPSSGEWGKELDLFLKNITQCTVSKVHKYPSKLSSCPWCEFKEKKNIIYFIDDDLIEQLQSLKNVDAFVNGFKIERLVFPKIEPRPAAAYALPIPKVDKKYRHYKWYQRLVLLGVLLAGFALTGVGGFIIGVGVAFLLNKLLPWNKKVRTELTSRQNAFADKKRKLDTAFREYERSAALKAYEAKGEEMQQLIGEFKDLPGEYQKGKTAVETSLYNQQLHVHLVQFAIQDHKIPGFGNARKQSLHDAGIRTASDIDQLYRIKVQGIGPKFVQNLLSWQRQVASDFVYKPNQLALKRGYEMLTAQIEQRRGKLEGQIRSEYQNLSYLKANVRTNQAQLARYIDQLQGEYYQAEMELAEFRRVAR